MLQRTIFSFNHTLIIHSHYTPQKIPAFDQIPHHIDDPCDVLNFALPVSNKTLHPVAVSRPLHYPEICTQLYNSSLWISLSRKDDIRASQIHSLGILPDSKYDVPRSLHSCKYDDTRKRPDPDCIPNEPEIGEPDIDAEKFIDAEDIIIYDLGSGTYGVFATVRVVSCGPALLRQ